MSPAERRQNRVHFLNSQVCPVDIDVERSPQAALFSDIQIKDVLIRNTREGKGDELFSSLFGGCIGMRIEDIRNPLNDSRPWKPGIWRSPATAPSTGRPTWRQPRRRWIQSGSPKRGRSRTPSAVPSSANTIQSQPCRLVEAMPLNSAPLLQPWAMRAP